MPSLLGYQVVDRNGKRWRDRPSDLILSFHTARRDIEEALKFSSHSYSMVAVLSGDIEDPQLEVSSLVDALNSADCVQLNGVLMHGFSFYNEEAINDDNDAQLWLTEWVNPPHHSLREHSFSKKHLLDATYDDEYRRWVVDGKTIQPLILQEI